MLLPLLIVLLQTPSSQQNSALKDAQLGCHPYMSNSTAQRDVHPEPVPTPSLAATCSRALTTAPLNTAELENLPQHMLVQLLGQVVAERDEAQTQAACLQLQLKVRDEEVEELKENRYFVEPKFVSDRVDVEQWDERIQRVLAKWKPRTVGPTEGDWTARGNVQGRLMYDKETKSVELTHDWLLGRDAGMLDLYQIMSSALLLYRVCCLFADTYIRVMGRDAYKWVWQAEIEHKATGEALGFSEHKAGLQVLVSNKGTGAEFENDMLELLNLLFDANFPHPYDGTVAGSIA